MDIKVGHTVYAACVDESRSSDIGFVLPLTVVSDKNYTPPKEGEHMRYVRRWWLINNIKHNGVAVYQSRRKAITQLKLKGITAK